MLKPHQRYRCCNLAHYLCPFPADPFWHTLSRSGGFDQTLLMQHQWVPALSLLLRSGLLPSPRYNNDLPPKQRLHILCDVLATESLLSQLACLGVNLRMGIVALNVLNACARIVRDQMHGRIAKL